MCPERRDGEKRSEAGRVSVARIVHRHIKLSGLDQRFLVHRYLGSDVGSFEITIDVARPDVRRPPSPNGAGWFRQTEAARASRAGR